MYKKDKEILRSLAGRVAEIAALPVQQEKVSLWRALNGLQPKRPMVMIDQVCWHEMNHDGSLTLACVEEENRFYETRLRRILYQWQHFPVDMVVEPTLPVPLAVQNSGFGMTIEEKTAVTDKASDVVGHEYINQFTNDADLARIKMPKIRLDRAESNRRLERAGDIFHDLLTVTPQGVDPYLSVWDPISMWMGVQEIMYALVDRADFMLALARRVVEGYLVMLDQLEEQGLLCSSQSLVHCTGAYTDELPAAGFNPARPRTKDLWMFGMAQLFAAVSPQMHEHFELKTSQPLFERFGLVYYGCCEPLDKKLAQVRQIPNLRKISMSPWVDEEAGAAGIGRDFVFSRKPDPALLAGPDYSQAVIQSHLQKTVAVCRRHACPLELILKDISTVGYKPERLWNWAKTAMAVVQS